MQVAGLDHYGTQNGRETRELCRAHAAALRECACFRGARIILVPEANLGNEAQEISEMLVHLRGITVLCSTNKAYGVYTNPGTPAKYVFRVEEKLAEEAIIYHEPLVCGNPFTNLPRAEGAKRARAEFERQMRSFRRVMTLPKSLSSRVRVAYSGKIGDGNTRTNRLRDDLCMAFLFGVYWSGQFLANRGPFERGYTSRFERPEGGTAEKRPMEDAATTSTTSRRRR